LPGMGQRLEAGQQGIADESIAYYAGALRQRPQSAQGFSRVVADYFRVTCKVEQSRWVARMLHWGFRHFAASGSGIVIAASV